MLPPPLHEAVERQLADHLGRTVRLQDHRSVSGGCIHNAQKLETDAGTFFLKYNVLAEAANFRAEARGLALLRAANAIALPRVIATGEAEQNAFLLLAHIASAPKKRGFWTEFGQQLAALHRNTAATYGLDHDNFIGRLPQANAQTTTWTDFFIHQRLEPQFALANKQGLVDFQLRKQFDALYTRLDTLIPIEPPSLLHGDLWSGNFMVGSAGQPVLIDPAVHYGHREAEIAFTRMFGGFDREFYAAYNATWPLAPGWESRIPLFNLYPLMVHLNLFGRSYLPEIQHTLSKLVSTP